MMDETNRLQTVRSGLVVGLMGLAVALFALILLPFPTIAGDDNPLTTGLHFAAITDGFSSGNLGRALVAMAVYVALVAVMALLVVAWTRGARFALWALAGIGLFGVAYAGGNSIPFVGPIMAVCGFSMITAGAALGLAVGRAVAEEKPVEDGAPPAEPPADEIKTDVIKIEYDTPASEV